MVSRKGGKKQDGELLEDFFPRVFITRLEKVEHLYTSLSHPIALLPSAISSELECSKICCHICLSPYSYLKSSIQEECVSRYILKWRDRCLS